MNIHFFKRLTATMIVSAGILTFDIEPVFAQGQAGQTGSSSTSTQNKDKKSNASSGMNSDKSMSKKSTNMFVEKASQSNLAEIELSKLAVEKGSTEKVREFAQMMIDHHTTAQVELYSVASKLTSTDQNMSGNAGNDANDETDIESTNNDADKTATLGGTGGTTGNSMAEGKTNGEFNSNRSGVDTNNSASDASSTLGTAGTDTNSENNSSSPGTGTSADTRMPGNTSGTGNTASGTNTESSGNTSMANEYLPSELSAEHKAIKNKLSILSGAEFDRQYMQAMVKDHAKAVELFEKQALQTKNPALQSYASKMLPIIKEHYQVAQQLSK